jgi:hypothetical protein
MLIIKHHLTEFAADFKPSTVWRNDTTKNVERCSYDVAIKKARRHLHVTKQTKTKDSNELFKIFYHDSKKIHILKEKLLFHQPGKCFLDYAEQQKQTSKGGKTLVLFVLLRMIKPF